MKTKLIILGCGNSTGVPRIDGYWGNCNQNNKKNLRTRCSAIIQKGSNSVLIDTSPDIREQFLKNKITDITSVIFTHEHADQTSGLFELRPFLWIKKKKIDLYADPKTLALLKKRFNYCFKKTNYYPPIVKGNLIKKKFSLGKYSEKINFKTMQAKHGAVKSTIIVFNKTAYISDCNDLSIINAKMLKNLKYLIIDCLKLKKNFSHFSLNESIFIHNSIKPKKTILTNLHPDLDYKFLLKILPNNVLPAYDGLNLNI